MHVIACNEIYYMVLQFHYMSLHRGGFADVVRNQPLQVLFKSKANDAILHHHHHDLQVAQGILGNIEHNITSSLCAIEY